MIAIRKFLDHVCWYAPSADEDTESDAFPWLAAGIQAGFSGVEQGEPPGYHYPRQVHGKLIIEQGSATQTAAVLAPGSSRTEADGLYSCQPDTKIAVQTADCLPLLFSHPRCVMAVHAGWKGLAAGIIMEAAACLRRLNIAPSEVQVVLGPAISQAAFEVGPELVKLFDDYFKGFEPQGLSWILTKGKNDRWHIDLAMAACITLQAMGFAASQVFCYRVCTKSNLNWHSYRRDGHKAGRNWSWISLPES